MFYTLGTAAKATGKTKTAIADSVKKGRITAAKDDFGRYQIDPAELHRVYPPVSERDGKDDPQQGRDKTQEFTAKIMMLEVQVKALGELKDQIAAERDGLREDRDHWRRQATALLTSSQPPRSQPRALGGYGGCPFSTLAHPSPSGWPIFLLFGRV